MKYAFALLLLAGSCVAQNKLLLVTDGAVKTADFFFTTRNYAATQRLTCGNIPGHGPECWHALETVELDPIARPFVSHGRPLAAGFFAASWFADYFVSRSLARHGHSRMAKAMLLLGIGSNAYGATTSIQGWRNR